MLKKMNDFLAGWPMTLIAGVFLLLDLMPHLMEEFGYSYQGFQWPIDPAWITIVICGLPLVYLAVWRIIHNPGISKISSALLIVIAMFAAIAIGDLFAAGEVAFIMAVGALLEDMTTERAKKGLKKLLSLTPVQGRRVRNGKEEMIPAEEIELNDILRVLPGETIPVDGVIVSGETSVDQSIMTGESLPVDKGVGDQVFCGTMNRFGAVDIEAVKIGEDSSLQQLIRMVEEAEDKKAPMARIADKAASWLVPVALLIAILTGIFTHNIVRAVTVLVVFCPCALVLATPTAIMAAIGQATKRGVIVKSGEALEKMGKASVIAFDKTGTLTHGTLEVSDVISVQNGLNSDDLLSLAAAAESRSEHPLGKAIAAFAVEEKLNPAEPESFSMRAGKGVTAQVSGKTIRCGSEGFLNENGILVNEDTAHKAADLRNQGKAVILIADGNTCVGLIGLSDVLRDEARDIVSELHDADMELVLLTGDNQKTADYFARKAGIDQVRAQLLPEDKVSSIVELENDGKVVCMVGDGVNDAPALKTANIGVAMGSMGSDIAVEAADIALMSDDISKIPYLKRLANATVKTIKFSIGLSMCINAAAVTLSVMGVLNPTTGALVHNAGSILVVMIAALLYDRNFDSTGKSEKK